jgi:hypothetical protein
MSDAAEHEFPESEHPIEDALKHVKEARLELEEAGERERKAELKLKEAVEELERAEEDRDRVNVHVVHVNEVEKVAFKMSIHATLQAVWDEAYVKLKITRNPKDIFETEGPVPVSLMGSLGLTIEQAEQRGVITNTRFEIVAETGGA